MLYSNFRVSIESRQVPEGEFRGAIFGNFQPSSRRFYLKAPRKVGRFIRGDRPDLFLNRDLSRPEQSIWRVSKSTSAKTHLILTSRHPEKRDAGIGHISAPVGQTIELLDYATSGRLDHATWQVVLLEASLGDVFAVSIRTNKEILHRCYIVGESHVIETTKDDFVANYEEQLRQLDNHQRRHTVANLQDGWVDVINPRIGACRLF